MVSACLIEDKCTCSHHTLDTFKPFKYSLLSAVIFRRIKRVIKKQAVWINLLYWNDFADCNEKNYRIWFLPSWKISSCGISKGKINSVNWLLCYRFFDDICINFQPQTFTCKYISYNTHTYIIQYTLILSFRVYYDIFIPAWSCA